MGAELDGRAIFSQSVMNTYNRICVCVCPQLMMNLMIFTGVCVPCNPSRK
jgi:hypothetical protein